MAGLRKKKTISINQMRNDQFHAAKKSDQQQIVASRETKKNVSKIVWRSIGVALKCHFRFCCRCTRFSVEVFSSGVRRDEWKMFVAFWRHKRNFSVDFVCAILHSFVCSRWIASLNDEDKRVYKIVSEREKKRKAH